MELGTACCKGTFGLPNSGIRRENLLVDGFNVVTDGFLPMVTASSLWLCTTAVTGGLLQEDGTTIRGRGTSSSTDETDGDTTM